MKKIRRIGKMLRRRTSMRAIAYIAVLVVALSTVAAHALLSPGAFTSPEVKFTDSSADGLQIVPASCASDPDGCMSPASLGASCDPNTHTASFSWGGVTGADYYDFYAVDTNSQQAVSSGSCSSNTTGTSCSIPGLYGSYDWSVAACDSSGCSAPTQGNTLSCVASSVSTSISETEVSPGDGAAVRPGDTITYQINFANTGNTPQTNMSILDTVSANTQISWQGGGTGSDQGLGDQSNDGSTARWDLSNFSTTGINSGYVRFSTTVNSNAPDGVQICNYGSITSDQLQTPQTSNTVCNTVSNPSLSIVQSEASGPSCVAPGAPVQPGDAICYVLTFGNTGNTSQTDVYVNDMIPANTTLAIQNGGTTDDGDSNSPPGTAGTNGIWWKQSGLAAGQGGQQVSFNVTVNPGVPDGTQICNTGLVNSDQVDQVSSNQVCHTVGAATCPDGSAAPNDDPTQCTCAQGNTSACTSTLNADCTATPASIAAGQSTTWSADITGGTPPYQLFWADTEGNIDDTGSNATTWGPITYDTAGPVEAGVIVYDSAGNEVTPSCALAVTPGDNGPSASAVSSCVDGAGQVAISWNTPNPFVAFTDQNSNQLVYQSFPSGDSDTVPNLQAGTYSWSVTPGGAGTVTVPDDCGLIGGGPHCPDGSPAPNNDPTQCTCAQGNATACVINQMCPPGYTGTYPECIPTTGTACNMSFDPTSVSPGQYSTLTWEADSDGTLYDVNGTSSELASGSLQVPAPATESTTYSFLSDQGSYCYANLYTGDCPAPNVGASCPTPNDCGLTGTIACDGSCVPPSDNECSPGISVTKWQVKPLLVQKQQMTQISWQVQNASVCTVSGTNGDGTLGSTDSISPGVWSALSGTETSSGITAQTVYTLHCLPLLHALPDTPVLQTATVNIVPGFQEQ